MTRNLRTYRFTAYSYIHILFVQVYTRIFDVYDTEKVDPFKKKARVKVVCFKVFAKAIVVDGQPDNQQLQWTNRQKNYQETIEKK